MDAAQAASKLLPGTSWVLRSDGINFDLDILEQAEDGTLRVNPPTAKEINDFISANQPKAPVPTEKQISAIWDYLDTKNTELPQSTKDVLAQVKAAK